MLSTPRPFATGAFLLGLVITIIGVLMIVSPTIFIKVLIVLLGIPVFCSGIGLILFGLNIWRGWPDLQRRVRIDQWRVWRND